MRRAVYFAYGVTSYLLFLACYAYLAGFFGNLLVPKTIDGPATSGPLVALGINLALMGLFGVQHSVMARPAFKRWWTRYVPEPIERSTYVLLSNAAVAALVLGWQPLHGVIWRATSPGAVAAAWTLFAVGWLGVPLVTWMTGHFDLVGVRQVWCYLRGQPYQPHAFRVQGAYRWVRHPLYVGWMIAFWATPVMTVGHLLLAAGLTGYMLLAVRLEERDLVAHFGRRYAEYARQVPRFVPRVASYQPAALELEEDAGRPRPAA